MNKKRILEKTLTLSLIFLASGITAGLMYEVLYFLHRAEVVGEYEIKAYVNGVFWPSGTEINWGKINSSSSYIKLLKVENSGDFNATIYLNIAGLPENMTLTWPHNGTLIEPGEFIEANLVLTTGDVHPGNYTWDSWIKPV